MKILIAPLNWGLGHATRCLPLISRHLKAGDEVVLGGDGDSLALLRKHFPELRVVPLPHLALRYSSGKSQVLAVLRMLPRLLWGAFADHRKLEKLLQAESFDWIISDNRFGLFTKRCPCVYITHQLLIAMPPGWRWLEGLVHGLHVRLIGCYTECWVPDYADERSLAGPLTHRYPLPDNARFIGPLSRFENVVPEEGAKEYDVVAVLSGLEPQRTLFEESILREYTGQEERLLLVRGRVQGPLTTLQKGNITLVPTISDEALARHLLQADTIISRSGYSSLMDYAALGLLEKAKQGKVRLRLVATPGQPEQVLLCSLFE